MYDKLPLLATDFGHHDFIDQKFPANVVPGSYSTWHNVPVLSAFSPPALSTRWLSHMNSLIVQTLVTNLKIPVTTIRHGLARCPGGLWYQYLEQHMKTVVTDLLARQDPSK